MSCGNSESSAQDQVEEDVLELLKVAEEGLLSSSDILKILLCKLSSKEKSVVKGICDVLVMELQRDCRNESYVCPYGLQDPQHPFITILAANENEGVEIAERMKELLNHQDEDVRQASRRFLKPVFLYVVKNFEKLLHVKNFWSLLVAECLKDDQGSQLFLDCLKWLGCEKSFCLNIFLLIDALEALIPAEKPKIIEQVLLLMAGSLPNKMKLGFSPSGSLQLMLSALKSGVMPQRLILLICSQILEDIPPHEIDDLLLVVEYLVNSPDTNNLLIRSMLLDSLVFWSHEESPISNTAKLKIKYLRQSIEIIGSKRKWEVQGISNDYIQFFPDRNVSSYLDIQAICCIIEELLANREFQEVIYLLDMMKSVVDPAFVNLFCKLLRGILSCPGLTVEFWRQVLEILVIFVKTSEVIARKTLWMLRYLLTKPGNRIPEPDLLQGIVECGHFRIYHNIIVSLIHASDATSSDQSLRLYLRLWQIDSATYQHLHDQLMATQESSNEALQLARAEAIKEICAKNPMHHRHDLLDNILELLLNQSDEVASVALEAFVHLCEDHSKRTLEACKKLETIYRDEVRTKVITALCRFYQHVPEYSALSSDHEAMTNRVCEKLWEYALESKDQEVQKATFEGLRKFPLELIKNKFKDHQSENWWLQLLQKVDKRAIIFAEDFITALIQADESSSISQEIVEFINQADTNNDFLINCVRILSQNVGEIENINWKCMTDLSLRNVEARQYCFTLAIKQSSTSTSAQFFIIICLQQFLPDVIEAVFQHLSTLLSNVITNDQECGRKYYLDLCFRYAFKANTLTTLIQKSIPSLDDNQLSVVVEVLQLLQFRDFIFGNFEMKHRDFWFKFALQQDLSAKRFICCKLAQQHKTTKLLDPILTHISDPSQFDSASQWEDFESLREELLRVFLREETQRDWNPLYKLAPICCSNNIDDEDFLNWILQILKDMEFSLTVGGKDFENYCKIFMDTVQIFSTYFPVQSILYGYEICEETSKFPYSLALIAEQTQFKDHCTQIYEYLFRMIKMPELPENILVIFKTTLVLAKDLPYFEQDSAWTKIMSTIG